MRARWIAAFAAPCLLLAACGSAGGGSSTPAAVRAAPSLQGPANAKPAPPSPVGGIGSTVDDMRHIHGQAGTAGGPCSTPNACFGSNVTNTESGTTFSITDVSWVNDLVGGYQQNFFTGMSASKAMYAIMQYLPADAQASTLTPIPGAMASCAYFNVSSPTLAALFPDNGANDPFGSPSGATVGVELSTTTSQGFTLYEPANVQDARLKLGANDSSMAC